MSLLGGLKSNLEQLIVVLAESLGHHLGAVLVLVLAPGGAATD